MKDFKDIAAFLAFMEGMPARMAAAGTRGLELAAMTIQVEAKSVLGTYQQEDMGPFAPWPELADVTKADRLKQGFTENDPGLRRGDMRESIVHAVDGLAAAVGSNDENLEWFDQGTKRQPPRSVLGVAAARRVDAAVDAIAGHVAAALSNSAASS